MNAFIRDNEGAYQPAHPEQIINLAKQIISDRLHRSEDIVATSPQDVQTVLAVAIGFKRAGGILDDVPGYQA